MARLWCVLLVVVLVAVHTSARNVPTEPVVQSDATISVPDKVVVLDHATSNVVPAEDANKVVAVPTDQAVVHNDAKDNAGNKNGVKDKKCIVGFAGVGGAAGVGTVFPVLGGMGGVGGAAGGVGGIGGLGGLAAGGIGGFKKGGFIIP